MVRGAWCVVRGAWCAVRGAWCVGALVRWCVGALVRWCVGACRVAHCALRVASKSMWFVIGGGEVVVVCIESIPHQHAFSVSC
jgi:hypothetical protein